MLKFLVVKIFCRKFWWQNLSSWKSWVDQIEHFIFIDASRMQHESWRSENSPFVDLLMIFDRVLMSFDIVVSFLTSWFHFWHVQLQVIAHVMFTVFFLSFIFVVRDFIYDFISDFIYDFISDFIYDFINCQSCLRLHCTNVGYI